MGADGGIVAIKLLAPENEQNHALSRLREIIPWQFLYWDNRQENNAYLRESGDQFFGYVISSYGSFQTFSLFDLPNFIEESENYSKIYPNSTFLECASDFSTQPWHDYRFPDLIKFFNYNYMLNYNTFSKFQYEEWENMKIKTWVNIVNNIINKDYVLRHRTWT